MVNKQSRKGFVYFDSTIAKHSLQVFYSLGKDILSRKKRCRQTTVLTQKVKALRIEFLVCRGIILFRNDVLQKHY